MVSGPTIDRCHFWKPIQRRMMTRMGELRGRYSRGYLPHFDAGRSPQFITWRLADAVPGEAIERWQEELSREQDSFRKAEIARRIESHCDSGSGEGLMSAPKVADAVQEVLFEGHGAMFDLHCWVIMPNHVHLILSPAELSVGEVVRRLKGASSREINRQMSRSGRLWQPGFFDRLIRTSEHFDRTRSYIEWNPVKAKLCTDPALWRWSSGNSESRNDLEIAGRGRNLGV